MRRNALRLFLLGLCFSFSPALRAVRAVEVSFQCNPSQIPALRAVVADWKRDTGNTVIFQTASESSSEALETCRKLLADGSAGIDIYNMDSVWPAILAEHLLYLRVYMGDLKKLHLPDAGTYLTSVNAEDPRHNLLLPRDKIGQRSGWMPCIRKRKNMSAPRKLAPILSVCLLFLQVSLAAEAVELTMYCNPIEAPYVRECVQAWEAKTGNKVRVLTDPTASTDVLALYQQQLAAGTSDVDVYEADVIWPGLLANHLIDLKPYSRGAEKLHAPPVIANNTIGGRLVAMPLYLDAGMKYYRKDLLEKYALPVPKTWGDLAAAASRIIKEEKTAGTQKLWGLVFQGKAYEGLTCVALEWIDSYGGGTIVDADGKVTVNNPEAVAVLKEAASWIGTIAPEGALNYSEEEARGVFQSGNAVFMRNWPYALSLAEAEDSPVKGKIGVMPIPRGGKGEKSSGALGGWGVAVSKYTRHPEAAANLLFYLTGEEGQKSSVFSALIPPALFLFSPIQTSKRRIPPPFSKFLTTPFPGSPESRAANTIAFPASFTMRLILFSPERRRPKMR